MLRKIFSSLLLVILLTNSTNFVFADVAFKPSMKTNLSFKISASKSKINNFPNWSKYIPQLNKTIEFINAQTDVAILEKIKTITKLKNWKVSWDEKLNSELINCLVLVIDKKIENITTAKKINILSQINNPLLTKEELKKVGDEIVKIQINLLNSTKTAADNWINDFIKSLNSEKTGNIKLNIEWSWAMIWNWKGELNIKDINSRSANFDSQLEAQIDLLVESSMRWSKNMKTQFSSFVNFINKDGNMYLLLQKLKYSWLEEFDYSWKMNTLLTKLKALWDKNQYVKIEDKQSEMALAMFKNFDTNTIYNEANKILIKPMLKPYKKEGNKYLLVPTKEYCDSMKYLSYKLSQYWDKICSDDEYSSMIESVMVSWNLYIIIDWTDKHLWWDINENWTVWYVKIYFSDKIITKALVKVDNVSWKDTSKLEITYIKWQKLDYDIDLTSNKDKINISFKSLLSGEDTFNKIDFIANIPNEWFKWNFKLENKKFNGSIELTNNNIKLNWNLSWELNNLDDLVSLNFIVKATIDSRSNFDMNYVLMNEIITWTMSYKENNSELIGVKSTWKYKKEYIELNNIITLWLYWQQVWKGRDASRIANINALRWAIEQYYQDDSEYPSVKDFNKIKVYIPQIPKDPLWNVEINWCKFGFIYEVWPDSNWIKNQIYKLSTCLEDNWNIIWKANNTMDWWSDNNRIEVWVVLKNWIYWEKYYINWYKNWTKYNADASKNPYMNINTKIEWNMNKNKLNLYIDYNSDDWYFKFNLNADSKVESKSDIKINAPTNTINLNDLMWTNTNKTKYSY